MSKSRKSKTVKIMLDKTKFCTYCGVKFSSSKQKLKTVDHILPRAKGGSNTKDNIAICCYLCNRNKADLTLEEFQQHKRGNHLLIHKDLMEHSVRYWIVIVNQLNPELKLDPELYSDKVRVSIRIPKKKPAKKVKRHELAERILDSIASAC